MSPPASSISTAAVRRCERWAPYLTATVGGAFVGLCWLVPAAFPLAWLGCFLLLLTILDRLPNFAMRCGLLFGGAWLAVSCYWYVPLLAHAFRVTHVTATLVFGLLLGWFAFQVGIFGYVAARFRPRGLFGPLVYPAVWVSLEFLWPFVFPRRLGDTQIRWTTLIQLAEIAGVYGVSFLMIWVCAVTAIAAKLLLARRRGSPAPFPRALALQAAACGIVLLLTLSLGVWRIDRIERSLANEPILTIALVQPGAGPADDGFEGALREQTDSLSGVIDLVCWPETSVASYSLRLTDFRSPETVAALSRNGQFHPGCDGRYPLLCGGGSYADDAPEEGPYRNTAFLVNQQGEIAGRYDKRALMPWCEYAPVVSWLPWLRKLVIAEPDAEPGASAAPLQVPGGGRVGVLICYEDMKEKECRDTVAAGAQVLIGLHNGSAFGENPAVHEHEQIAFLRAVESRRYFLRCGTTGCTAVISPTGRVVARVPTHAAATLLSRVQLLDVRTIYTQCGDVLPIACVLAVVALGLRRPIVRGYRSLRRMAKHQLGPERSI